MPTPPLKKPAPLGQGSTIGLVAPAVYLDNDAIQQGVNVLHKMGYKTKVHPQCHLRHHCRAGTAKERGQAINDLFADPEVDGILSVRGGSGCMRTENWLDYTLIGNNPKVFCGYSDITLLLHSIQKQAGLVTYHGPILRSFFEKDGITLSHFADVMAGNKVSLDIPQPHLMHKGTAQGSLVGGNLSLLATLLGTPDEPDMTNAILFIEDVGEEHYALDRILWHLRRAGKLDDIAGVMVGEMIDVRESRLDYGITIWDSLMELFGSRNIPIVGNAPIGHGKRVMTLPMGISATLRVTGKNASLTLEEPATVHHHKQKAG